MICILSKHRGHDFVPLNGYVWIQSFVAHPDSRFDLRGFLLSGIMVYVVFRYIAHNSVVAASSKLRIPSIQSELNLPNWIIVKTHYKY